MDLPKANADYKDLLIDIEVLKDILNYGMFAGTRRRPLTQQRNQI